MRRKVRKGKGVRGGMRRKVRKGEGVRGGRKKSRVLLFVT